MSRWRITLARPQIGDAERAAVDAVLRTGNLSRGPAIAAFEAAFRERCGTAEAVAVSSGTAALALGLDALEPRPTRVVTTAFTVPATVNAALTAGFEVALADIDPDTLALDPVRVAEIVRPGDLVLPVHAFGHPAQLRGLGEVCGVVGAMFAEDACEALGTSIGGRPAGSVGRFGTFGFYPNKQITTGEGGMLVTDDPALAARVRKSRNHGRRMDGSWLDQDDIGTNARLSELAAALGTAQLARLDELLDARRRVAMTYDEALADVPGLRLPASRPGYAETALFAYVVVLAPELSARRDALVQYLADAGIQAGRYFAPLHRQPAHAAGALASAVLPVTDAVSAGAVALPFHGGLTEADVLSVARAVAQFQMQETGLGRPA